eukprot:15351736-Ditylum_brightwellii.AAC.1
MDTHDIEEALEENQVIPLQQNSTSNMINHQQPMYSSGTDSVNCRGKDQIEHAYRKQTRIGVGQECMTT